MASLINLKYSLPLAERIFPGFDRSVAGTDITYNSVLLSVIDRTHPFWIRSINGRRRYHLYIESSYLELIERALSEFLLSLAGGIIYTFILFTAIYRIDTSKDPTFLDSYYKLQTMAWLMPLYLMFSLKIHSISSITSVLFFEIEGTDHLGMDRTMRGCENHLNFHTLLQLLNRSLRRTFHVSLISCVQ